MSHRVTRTGQDFNDDMEPAEGVVLLSLQGSAMSHYLLNRVPEILKQHYV